MLLSNNTQYLFYGGHAELDLFKPVFKHGAATRIARLFPQHFKVESERLLLEGTRELLEAIDQAERGPLKTYTKPDPPGPLYSLVGLTNYLRAARG